MILITGAAGKTGKAVIKARRAWRGRESLCPEPCA
jgi:ribosomal protein L34